MLHGECALRCRPTDCPSQRTRIVQSLWSVTRRFGDYPDSRTISVSPGATRLRNPSEENQLIAFRCANVCLSQSCYQSGRRSGSCRCYGGPLCQCGRGSEGMRGAPSVYLRCQEDAGARHKVRRVHYYGSLITRVFAGLSDLCGHVGWCIAPYKHRMQECGMEKNLPGIIDPVLDHASPSSSCRTARIRARPS